MPQEPSLGRGAQRPEDPLRDGAATLEIGLRQQDGELLAAVTRGQILRPQQLDQRSSDGLENLVAHRMAAAVVDLLEPVEIDQEKRQGPLVPARPAQLLFQAREKAATVGEAGEEIGIREPLELGVRELERSAGLVQSVLRLAFGGDIEATGFVFRGLYLRGALGVSGVPRQEHVDDGLRGLTVGLGGAFGAGYEFFINSTAAVGVGLTYDARYVPGSIFPRQSLLVGIRFTWY